MIPQTPSPAAAPQAPAIAGAPRTSAPSAIYQGLRAQRSELTNQLDELEGTRRELTSQMEELGPGDEAHKALQNRMTEIDNRIASVDGMLAANSAQIAQAAAIPGAVVESRPIERTGPPEEAFVLGGIFMMVAVLPISLAYARRIWRRSAVAVTSFPREMADRLSRIEQGMEATSLEVERIGEGQRFLTRLFTEGEGARAVSAGGTAKQAKIPERLP
jgi:cytochrome c biogenesis protein ResB